MFIFKKVGDLDEYLQKRRADGDKIGFVPTMGALHEGHISLVARCKADGVLSVCSIFVNPTQFNDKNDLARYPVSTEADMELLLRAGCDVLFLPDVSEIYPGGEDKAPVYDFGYLDTILEGAQRPGHFKGVGQVVARLLQIVRPQKLYMGQKDYQQCMVVRRLLQIMGTDTELEICPIIREADGLAMSSRNRRLTEPQRTLAGIIYQCLVSIQAKQGTDNFALVRKECEELLRAKGLTPEYVSLADARDLRLLDNYEHNTLMVALIAARMGDIRLIDNILL
ncbi:pantoate--beta-alanine ligase [Nemorincola caseinilytica]|uniref:Pantothenate synthetase n=1 Tax=Nemorincola caseinilytica TaxID=2054315 RepID=A0ABP8NLH6_9BACT